jgi:uncharacterized protein YhaN
VQRLSRTETAHIAELEERIRRLEKNEETFHDAVNGQLARADALAEDLVAAVERLRRRVDELERGS